MVNIYITDIGKELSNEVFAAHLKKIPLAEREKIIHFRHWEDRQAALFGRLLLKEGLVQYPGLSLQQLRYSHYQKPFIEGVHFNISHTRKCVGCIISDTHRVGIDIEYVSPIDLKDFRNCFNSHEWETICQSPNPHYTFFLYWTKKEAAIKADGRGMNLVLRNVRVDGDVVTVEDKPWFMTTVPFLNDHIIHIATDQPIGAAEIRYMETFFPSEVRYTN